MKYPFFILFSFFCFGIQAKTPISILVNVTYGEKVSDFQLKRNQGKATVLYTSGETRIEKTVSAKDLLFLESRLASGTSEAIGKICSRKNIRSRVNYEDGSHKTLTACLAASTPLSQRLTRIANLLAATL